MQTKTDPRGERRDARPAGSEPLPTWRNTRPRGNPEVDRTDLDRGRERFEALLGR